MPWTPKQVGYLLSKASPLTDEEQAKMKAELHEDPRMGHRKKGDTESAAYNWRRRKPRS